MYALTKKGNVLTVSGEKGDEIQEMKYDSTEQLAKISIKFNRIDPIKLLFLNEIIAEKKGNANVILDLEKEYYLSIESTKAIVYQMIKSLADQGVTPGLIFGELMIQNVIEKERHELELYNKNMHEILERLLAAPNEATDPISTNCGTFLEDNSFFAKNSNVISMSEPKSEKSCSCLEDEIGLANFTIDIHQ